MVKGLISMYPAWEGDVVKGLILGRRCIVKDILERRYAGL